MSSTTTVIGDRRREALDRAQYLNAALVRGFREMVADETGMPVYSAESPLTCVAFGSGQALDHFDELSRASRHRVPTLSYDWRTA